MGRRCRPGAARGRAGAQHPPSAGGLGGAGTARARPAPAPVPVVLLFPVQPGPSRPSGGPAEPPPCGAREAALRWRCCCCCCCRGRCGPAPATSPHGARWTPARCPPGLTRPSSASSSTGACSRCPASAASGSGERQPERSGGPGASLRGRAALGRAGTVWGPQNSLGWGWSPSAGWPGSSAVCQELCAHPRPRAPRRRWQRKWSLKYFCLPSPKLLSSWAEVTELRRELVELREVLCSTTVLVRQVVGGQKRALAGPP